MITLLSTWSKYSSESIGDIRLVTHQKAVWDATCDPDVQIVINTALTGDGKTLAALLPAAYEYQTLDKGLFAYPTNELIRDQAKQLKNWIHRLKIQELNDDEAIGELNSHSLAASMHDEKFDKASTLLNIARDSKVILTNPDIFTLIYQFYYNRWKGNIAQVAQKYLNQYRYVVFDEFHIFNAPQVTNVLDGIAFSRASLSNKYPTKYLFLSATPERLLVRALEKAGIEPKLIEGEYQHGLKDSITHRCILQEVELELVACQQSSGGIETWVSENLKTIQQFFADYPTSKGLIIVNSVFAAKRLICFLKEANVFNITIGENTGLTHPEVRKESEKAQLIVATSTVDVGVDFEINFLIYESLDAGTFIQRLGRLGRHTGFPIYQAIALVPDWVKEKFVEVYPNKAEIDRKSFFQTVRENIYRKPQEFEKYLCRWGKVLTTLRHVRLSKQKEQYQTPLKRYSNEATKILCETPKWNRINELKDHKIIISELERFRGIGQVDIWVHEVDTKAVTSMNLIRLLAGTEFNLITESEAKQISEEQSIPFYKNSLGLYFCIERYLNTYEKVELEFFGNLDQFSINQAQERSGFCIKARHPAIRKINNQLKYLKLTTCVADPQEYDIPALRRRYSLPAFFELRYVKDFSGIVYPVAFGLDALLLDSLLYWQKTSQAIIC